MIRKVRGELLFLGAIFAYIAYFYGSIRGFAYKATYWPYILMVLMLFFIAAVAIGVVLDVKRKEAFDGAAPTPEKKPLRQILQDIQPIIIIIASIAVYIFLLKEIGFMLCTFLFTFGHVWYFSGKKWKRGLLVATVASVVFFLVFDRALNMPLPEFYLHNYFIHR